MPVLRTTPRISPKEWEDRKHRLIELYLGHGLRLSGPNGVIEKMASEGFIATKAQYEHQFRTWRLRKNMKRYEYERIIQERQHGGEITPIVLEGRLISDARSERALRRYARRMVQTEGSNPRNDGGVDRGNITAPLMAPRGGRTPTENLTSEASIPITKFVNNITNDMDTPWGIGSADFNLDGLLVEQDNGEIDNRSCGNPSQFSFHADINDLISQVNFNLQGPAGDGLSSFQQSASSWILGQSMEVDVAQQHQLLSPQRTSTSFDMTMESVKYFSYSPTVASAYPYNTPNPHLALFQKAQWTPPSAAIIATLMEDILDVPRPASARDIVSNLRILTNTFVDDIQSIGNRNRPAHLTLALRSLYSKETFFGEPVIKLPDNTTIDVLTEARLYSRLITSFINGFAGLDSISAAGVMTFLNKSRTTNLSIIALLRSNPSPAIKSFTQNIFIAALEQDNVNIVHFLLHQNKSVYSHDTLCYYYRERYTPLEIAAINQSYGVIKILIERNADVNRTFTRVHPSNALDLLLRNRGSRSTIDDGFFCVVDQLLLAGAKISVNSLSEHIGTFIDQRIAIRLIEEFASQAPEELVSDLKFLDNIAKSFTKQDLERIIKLLIESCQAIGANWCSYQYLLHKAVEHEQIELVEMLVPYASSLSDVLSTARKFGDQEIINLIHKQYAENGIKTLITALRSGDQGHLLALDEDDILKDLKHFGLGQVFTVALEEGNLQFATRVLDIDPEFHFVLDVDYKFEDSIRAALTHDFDEIAWDLTTTLTTGTRTSRLEPLMYEAVVARKPDLVRRCIESGFKLWDGSCRDKAESSPAEVILEAAITWGDDSILQDLWRARCGTIYPAPTLMQLAAEKDQMALFWDIFEAWNTHHSHDRRWPNAISTAIRCQDLRLLDELIIRGARLDNDEPLEIALEDHPWMVKSLLERYRQGYPQGVAGYGRTSIQREISRRLKSSEWIDLFFDFGLIAKHIHQENRQSPTDGPTLLSYAIECFDPEEKHACKYLIERLLDAGSDVNITICDGLKGYGLSSDTTALLLAIQTENAEIVQLLIQRGAEVNRPARFGITYTPLQRAAERNNVEIVKLLLENGADVNAAPAMLNGATALQFAAIHGNCQIAMMLIEHGARLDVPPPKGLRGRWPLEGAAENGRLDMIQLLWDVNNGAFDGQQCQKAMRRAVYYGHLGCRDLIKQLITKSPVQY
ncbi:hypothetical protein F4859DRAFT_222325 [Xylaria cf. heliscus]|nr:hypothetical protein F4859DRAFT_222325 [Xylaria cf. heliscus]